MTLSDLNVSSADVVSRIAECREELDALKKLLRAVLAAERARDARRQREITSRPIHEAKGRRA